MGRYPKIANHDRQFSLRISKTPWKFQYVVSCCLASNYLVSGAWAFSIFEKRLHLFIIEIHVRRAAGRGYFLFHLSKSTWGEYPVEEILNFPCKCVYLCIYLFIYLCHASGPNEKRFRPENWHIYPQWPYLKTVYLFSKKSPCHVNFSAYLLDCLI